MKLHSGRDTVVGFVYSELLSNATCEEIFCFIVQPRRGQYAQDVWTELEATAHVLL